MAAITMATLIVLYGRIHFWAQTERNYDIWLWRKTGASGRQVLIRLTGLGPQGRGLGEAGGRPRAALKENPPRRLSVVTQHDNNGFNSGLPSILQLLLWLWRASNDGGGGGGGGQAGGELTTV